MISEETPEVILEVIPETTGETLETLEELTPILEIEDIEMIIINLEDTESKAQWENGETLTSFMIPILPRPPANPRLILETPSLRLSSQPPTLTPEVAKILSISSPLSVAVEAVDLASPTIWSVLSTNLTLPCLSLRMLRTLST